MGEMRKPANKNTIWWQRLSDQLQPLPWTPGLLRLRDHQVPATNVVNKITGQKSALTSTSQGGHALGAIKRDIGLMTLCPLWHGDIKPNILGLNMDH